MIFSRESLKKSSGRIFIILAICVLVFYWGRAQKVTVDLKLIPEVEIFNDDAQSVDISLFDGNQSSVATITQPVSPDQSPSRLQLKPGTYQIRGTVTLKSGNRRLVEQTIVVPENSATIEAYLHVRK